MSNKTVKLADIFPFNECQNAEEINNLILIILKDYIVDFSTQRISKVYRIDEDQLKFFLDSKLVTNLYLQLIIDQSNSKVNQEDLKQYVIDTAVLNTKIATQRGNIGAANTSLKILKDLIVDANDRANYELIMEKLQTLNEQY